MSKYVPTKSDPPGGGNNRTDPNGTKIRRPVIHAPSRTAVLGCFGAGRNARVTSMVLVGLILLLAGNCLGATWTSIVAEGWDTANSCNLTTAGNLANIQSDNGDGISAGVCYADKGVIGDMKWFAVYFNNNFPAGMTINSVMIYVDVEMNPGKNGTGQIQVSDAKTTSQWYQGVAGSSTTNSAWLSNVKNVETRWQFDVTAALDTTDKINNCEVLILNDLTSGDKLYFDYIYIKVTYSLPVTEFYYVGSASDWNTAANWATNSGGTGGAGIPASGSTAFFDANSGNCTLDTNAVCKKINTTGFTNTLALATFDLTVQSNLTHAGGTITISSSTSAGLDVGGSITNSATITCSGTSKIYCAGDWNGEAGTFTKGSSTVVFDGTSTQMVTTGGAWDWATTNNNWKNNWCVLRVDNAVGVIFDTGFKTEQFIATNVPNTTLSFQYQGEVTNVFEITASGGLNLSASGVNYIYLRRYGGSDANTNRWEICPSTSDANWTVARVDVSYSVNSATNYINPTNSVDSGNNINWFTPTYIALGWLEAIGRDNSVTVRWKTESEVNNAGFNIYRSTSATGLYTKVNHTFIWGLGSSTRGAEYRYVDDGVTNGIIYYYKLESVEFDGRSEFYGPAEAHPGVDTDGDGMTDDWESFYGLNPNLNDASGDPDGDGLSNYDEYLADTNPKVDEGEDGQGWLGSPSSEPEGGDSGIYKLYVEEDGIYRLTADYLENTAGITNLGQWTVANIRMYNQGSEIPLYCHNEGGPEFGTNDYVEFYGTKMDTTFTHANVYWLYPATNAGFRMPEISGPAGGTARTNCRTTALYEKNEYYWDQLPDEAPDDDHWFFTNLLCAAGSPASTELKPVLISVSGVDATAVIRVAFRGINYTTPHHVQVNINGKNLSDGNWSGDGEYIYSAETAQTNLVEGTNSLIVTLPGDTGVDIEYVLINRVEVDYLKKLEAADNSLIFVSREQATNQYSIDGYSSADVQVFKIAGPTNISVITDVDISGSYTATFSDNTASGITYAVVGPSARKTPASVVEDATSDLRSTTNGADYIAITHHAFHDAILPLARLREQEGMRVKVVKVQDIYDDFNFGIVSPYAIRDFLDYARENWVKPAPTYVLLVGDATYDYKDNLGLASANYVPVKMVHDCASLETPSDNWYVALDGPSDFVPDMYIGRLPARTTNEVTTMVNKIIAYEGAGAEDDWARNVMLVADDEPMFEAMSEMAYQYLPTGYVGDKIYLYDYAEATNCAADIINGFNQGALVTHFAGHGSTEFWAGEYIFGTWDMASLTNDVCLPLVLTPTCYNGYFLWPAAYDFEGLAEELVRKAGGGAIACFSPAGMSTPPNQEMLISRLFESVFIDGCFRVGPAITRAKLKTFEQLGEVSRNVIETFILFGDPALKLKQWTGYAGDTTPPQVVQTILTNEVTDILASADIRIYFSEKMDDVMTRAAFSISPGVNGTLYWDGNTLVFDPDSDLDCQTTYIVTIKSSACDLAGNHLDTDYTFRFNPEPVSISADTENPTIAITDPTGAATYSTTNPALYIAGTASDNIALSKVTFSNNRSESGTCNSTTDWSYNGIELYSGQNIITITAHDIAGNTAFDTLVVTLYPNYPGLDKAILRAGMTCQEINMPDNLLPGEEITVQWQILSYVPLVSAMRADLPSGQKVTINATRTGIENGRWHVGDRESKVYSFECRWLVPRDLGTCKVRFLAAQQDGYAYMNANIPGRLGVDWRPYGTDGKQILRDIVVSETSAAPVTENVITNPPWFDSLDQAILRAGGTIQMIEVPTNNLTPGTTVPCRWDVLSYVPIRSQIYVNLPTNEDFMAEATCTGVTDGTWHLSTYQSQVYSFEYYWTVPDDPGTCRIRFINAQTDGYAWMNGNIPGNVDTRPYGTDGKEIERDIE